MEEALRDLAPRWQRYWPGADVERIVTDVRERMSAALNAWSLDGAEPLRGGVGLLTCAAGDVVVKVLPRHHPEEQAMRGEAEALAHWRDTGACVPLLDRRDDGFTLLLRRLRPATSRSRARGSDCHDRARSRGPRRPARRQRPARLLLCPQAPALPHDDAVGELRRRIRVYCDAAGLDSERAERWVGVVARAEARLSNDSAFEWWPERLRQIGAALSRG
jgi:hypothetical protein